jgi:uncharacterized protein YndB with AHSA1/START domain
LLQFDFREGGAYRFAYHVPGGQIMTVRGVYRSIEPPSKIVFSWVIEPPDEHAGLFRRGPIPGPDTWSPRG